MPMPPTDLNLFRVFDAVYAERNLTRAARRLHITQPAVSNALKRLRDTFGDPLFVRTPRGVAPTPVADQAAGRIREALNQLSLSLAESGEFVPARASRSFSLSVHDIDEARFIPRLMQRLGELAPGVAVECYPVPRAEVAGELAAGNLDFAIDVPLFSVPQLCRQPIAADRYVCLLRRDHPLAAADLTLERYLQLDHVHVSTRRHGIGHVDRALESLGQRRRVRLRMTSYLAAPQVVASTDLALTVPRALARRFDLAELELPFAVEGLDQFLYWHRGAEQDRANAWMRETLLAVLGA